MPTPTFVKRRGTAHAARGGDWWHIGDVLL